MEDAIRRSKENEDTMIKVLGGFGCRAHMGDLRHVQSVDSYLAQLASINAMDVECMLVLAKVRVVTDPEKPETDKFNIIGGMAGGELELTALHALLAARLETLRLLIAQKIEETKKQA